MARISYDEQTAAAFKAVREVPRDGLSEWREAVRRHLRPSPGMTLADIGAGTGAFSAAFSGWFGLSVLAVEPSAAMRDQIPRTPAIQVLEGDAGALPLPMSRQTPRGSPWSSTTSQTSGRRARDPPRSAPRCSRPHPAGLPGQVRACGELKPDGIELVRWFPETARALRPFLPSRNARGVRGRRIPPGRS